MPDEPETSARQEPEPEPSSSEPEPDPPAQSANSFEAEAEGPAPGLLTEFWWFIRENKAWWLVPLLLALLLIGAIVWLSGSAVAPFIYPLF
jgi:hypothetical protein